MRNLSTDISKMVEILPQEDQRLVFEIVKKLVLAWDPDFTKVTPLEAANIKAAEDSGFVCESEINWDEIGA